MSEGRRCPIKWRIEKLKVKGDKIEIVVGYFVARDNIEGYKPAIEYVEYDFAMKTLLKSLKKEHRDLDELLKDRFLLPNIIRELHNLAWVDRQRLEEAVVEYHTKLVDESIASSRNEKIKRFFTTKCRKDLGEWAREEALTTILLNPEKYGIRPE